MTTFTPPIGVSYRTSVTKNYRTLENDFGDGYTQVVPDGMNSVLEVWSLSWDSLTDSQANEIEDFLDAQGGTPFEWETPKNDTRRFKSSPPTRTYNSYNNNTLTVTFTEQPGV